MNKYYILCGIFLFRILLAFLTQPSYIHPDEFFQSLEVLSNRIYGINAGIVPWEFKGPSPIRSLFILELFYGIPMRIMKYFNFHNLLLTCRVNITFFSLIIDYVIINIAQKLSISSYLTLIIYCTSHISIVFQSRTFSNSMESIIFVLFVNICLDKEKPKHSKFKICLESFLIVLGIFSRPTFLCYMVVPLLYKLKNMDNFKGGIQDIVLSSIFCTLFSSVFIYFDTYLYQSNHVVITPLNFLLYNTNKENLAIHGYHPFYTHILANLPQMFGLLTPFIYLSFYLLKSCHRILFYIIGFPVFILSFFPHQEMRFLMPIFPIACVALSYIFCALFKNNGNQMVFKMIILTHAVFSFSSVLFWGYLHEGGTVKAMNYISNSINQNNQDFHAICSYKMLIVPKSILKLKQSDFSKTEMINLMGMSENQFLDKIQSVKYSKKSKRGFRKYFIHIMYPVSIKLKNENKLMNLGNLVEIKFFPGHINTDLGFPNSLESFYLKYAKIEV